MVNHSSLSFMCVYIIIVFFCFCFFCIDRTGSNPKIRRNKIWGGQNGGILVYNSGERRKCISRRAPVIVFPFIDTSSWNVFKAWVSSRTMKSLTTPWQECGSRRTATLPCGGIRSMTAETAASAYSTGEEVAPRVQVLLQKT